MAIAEYVGAVVLEVDGREVECTSFSAKESTGKMPVKTMNRRRRIAGYCMGVATYELTVAVPIPINGSEEINWSEVVGAKCVIYPISGNGKRVAYTDCVVQDVSDAYESEGEAKRDLTLFAVNKVEE
jgi:predicted ATP-grasp superfamily ATP-dependent carboligase